jgi:hypothetical protein
MTTRTKMSGLVLMAAVTACSGSGKTEASGGGGPAGGAVAGGDQANALVAAPPGVLGEAYGVLATTAIGRVPKTPVARLAADGGLADSEKAAVALPGLVSTGLVTVTSPGGVGDQAAGSEATTTVSKVSVLDGVVSCDLVVAMSSSRSDGHTARSSADGSTFLGLTVAGTAMGDVLPAPNTRIPVPGVGTVVLNEQVASGDGVTTSGLQVNMIHVLLAGAVAGDLVVGSARSGAGYTATP